MLVKNEKVKNNLTMIQKVSETSEQAVQLNEGVIGYTSEQVVEIGEGTPEFAKLVVKKKKEDSKSASEKVKQSIDQLIDQANENEIDFEEEKDEAESIKISLLQFSESNEDLLTSNKDMKNENSVVDKYINEDDEEWNDENEVNYGSDSYDQIIYEDSLSESIIYYQPTYEPIVYNQTVTEGKKIRMT